MSEPIDYVGEALKRAGKKKKQEQTQGPEWLKLCQTGKHGGPLMNAANASIALADDPGIKDAPRFDEMTRALVLAHPIGQPEITGQAREWRDSDYTACQCHLQRIGLKTIGRDTVIHAVEARAMANNFHPVRDWLNSLAWDETERMKLWLQMSLGAENTEYHQEIGKMFLIAMVARIFEPGCKADYMIILEGEQGEEKSKICKILAGEWFSDNMPDIQASPKDASLHLRGKWLVEISEMHAFNRAESTHLKQFITQTTERYRPPYGRGDVTEPRQNLFIGTTNKEIYLKDETGGRRFWPVKTGTLNVEWITANRNQLFAEAVTAYNAGAQQWPDRKFEREHIRPHQEARFDSDAWEEPITDWLNRTTLPDVTILEVAQGALGYGHGEGSTPVNRLGRADQNRIAAVLTTLNWERAPRTEYRKPWRRKKAAS